MAIPRNHLSLIVLSTLLAACQPANLATQALPTTTLLPLRAASATPSPALTQGTNPDSVPIGPSPTPFVHIVQQGETLLGIALRYGVALDDLILVNPGVDPGFLTIGQQLRIPGEEGEAVDTLLPSPTPVPVEMSPVECFKSPSGALTCLLEVRNDSGEYVRGLTVVVRLLDRGGGELTAQLANAPLEFLGPGMSLPLSVHYSEIPIDFSSAVASVQSAIRIPPPDPTEYRVGVEIQPSEKMVDPRMARVFGVVSLQQLSASQGSSIRILGIVRDSDHQVAGYQILDLLAQGDAGDGIPFTMDIFSLGPAIGSVELIAEVKQP